MYTSIPASIEAQWIIWHIQFPKIKLCISTIYHSQVDYGEDFPLSSPLFCMVFQPSPGAASGRIHAPGCTDPSSIEKKWDVCLINLMAFLVKDSLNVVFFPTWSSWLFCSVVVGSFSKKQISNILIFTDYQSASSYHEAYITISFKALLGSSMSNLTSCLRHLHVANSPHHSLQLKLGHFSW